MDRNIICGSNSVKEHLHNIPGNIEKVFIVRGSYIFNDIIDLCRQEKVPYKIYERKSIPGKIQEYLNRGVCAFLSDQNILSLSHILSHFEDKNNESKIMILFDRITNVGNAGAIVRSGIAFGIRDFIFEINNSVSISSVLGTSSSGYSSLARLYRISSPSGLINKLKNIAVNIISIDMSGTDLKSAEFRYPALIVFGSEDKGIRSTIIKKSDMVLRIPTENSVESLNVSCAASIVFYEIQGRR